MHGDYERLVEATATELFGGEKAGEPVYTLAEPDILARIIAAAGLDGDPLAALCSGVRSTLHLDTSGIATLRWHQVASAEHARRPMETPPSLPLMVVLTLAAEQMQAGEQIAAHNYYGRLHPLLSVPEARQDNLVHDYRRSAEVIWGSLNAWLEAWEGERGVPTAYALGAMRYIGLPMSQAVVRRHDREGLHQVFAFEGLPPGSRMGAPDMEMVIDPYATKVPTPLSSQLRSLWSNQSARERIVQAACLELESWTGVGKHAREGSTARAATRLVAYMRTFPRKVIELNLAMPVPPEGPGLMTFRTNDGEIRVPTVAGPTGTMRLATTDALSAESLLEDVVTGDSQTGGSIVERRPRRVLPLRWDELQGCFVEVERVAMGEDNLVLAMADAKHRVEVLLETCARPGWELLEDVAGLPQGWIVFRHVQILSVPEGQVHVELLPLVSRARTSLTLRGGFSMPGRLRKWSSLDPPEVVALGANHEVSVRVYRGSRLGNEDLVVHEGPFTDLAIVNLEEHGLDDGEYTVALFIDMAKQPASTATLRLRSADSPLFNVEEVDLQLVYSPSDGAVWPLSAGPAVAECFINGARVVGNPPSDSKSMEVPEFRPRERRIAPVQPKRMRLGRALPPDSCMTTGKHRIQYPTAHAGRPPSRTIEGECETCGLVKRGAATASAAKKKLHPIAGKPRVVIPPIAEHDDANQHIAFDALSHVGHGNYGVFERIASQIEGSGLFADTFLRRQEVTGHIDVRRDEFLLATEWAVNAATLVPVSPGSWVLIGARSKSLVNNLREVVGDDGRVDGSTDAGILRILVEVAPDRMMQLAPSMAELGVTVMDESPALAMARALPSLGEVERGLKRVAVPPYQSLEVWNTQSAAWVPATSLTATGAFRLRDFRATYVVRSRSDLDNGTVAIASAHLAKHIANRWVGDPLVGYHARSGSVVVPLGAELPALYGRALSVCSGRAPRELPDTRMVQYLDVPVSVAQVVMDRLMA
jgi:hypothetical protein